MNKKKPLKIEYRIVEIKKISHFEKDFTEYGFTAEDIKTGKVEISLNLNIDGKKGTLAFLIKAKCYHPSSDRDFPLFGIEVLYKYRIRNLNKLFKIKDQDKYNFPDNLMHSFINMAISGARGMLAALNTTPAYQTIFLPIVNPKDLILKLKKDIK